MAHRRTPSASATIAVSRTARSQRDDIGTPLECKKGRRACAPQYAFNSPILDRGIVLVAARPVPSCHPGQGLHSSVRARRSPVLGAAQPTTTLLGRVRGGGGAAPPPPPPPGGVI